MAKKAVKQAPAKAKARKPLKAAAPGAPVLLAGGNPQIAKGDGDAVVQTYIAAVPGWKRQTCARLDTLITRTLPKVRKAVKWNSPFYGADATTFFLSFHCFTRYVKVAFFCGAELKPPPPGASKQRHVRYLDIHEDDALDEKQFVAWVKQSSALPGEKM